MKRSAVPPAVEHAHSMGPTALERALVAALAPQGIGELPYGQHTVNGLIGWAVLRVEAQRRGTESPKPNSSPWQHLGDLTELSEQLSSALG
jgi:hypothetical protein